ncbi:queuosine precursor transporter [Enemella sp. A6]|uniref:queuosine precursor transporter n=1 Tax=Enemella sp. A6 TaxID=3440152 RepID=UPI003EBF25B4
MTPPPTRVRRGNYDIVVAGFCALLLISNIGATKLIEFGPIITDGGAFLFPLTYILGDVLAEVYGLRRARRAIVLGFALSIIASLTFLLVLISPPAADWPKQEAWEAVLGFVPRIVAASLVGYLAGQLLNAWVLVKIKQRTGERSLWARLIGSTLVGEAADTVLFCTIAFAGEVSGATLLNYIAVGYFYKVLVEALLLPITYRVVALVRAHEPDDVLAEAVPPVQRA